VCCSLDTIIGAGLAIVCIFLRTFTLACPPTKSCTPCWLPAPSLPGENFYGLAADSAFRIPLWRHVYTWLGIVPASVANLKKHIKWGCVACTPGGIAEMYLAGGESDHIYIKSRKGFVSVAVEEGINIVPVYHFGNTAILSFGPKFLEPYGRRWRFSLGLLYGDFWLPIPRRVQLMMVVGPPVAVEKVSRSDPRFQEVVDETHGRYMATLQALFEKYKGVYGATCEGWADRQLVMH
jgi:2-acylglycerol O-acyltransferase 2